MDYIILKLTIETLVKTAKKRREHYTDFADDDITDIITVIEVIFDEWKDILTDTEKKEINKICNTIINI